MAITAVIGGQWGDEGKGKIVDLLSRNANMVARFQGGANAGHTVYHKNNKIVLHQIPTGILRPDSKCILGKGMVIDPIGIIEEIECLNKKFDPNFHQAILEVEDNTKEPGTIVQEVQKGYMMKDRLLRPSFVGVAKKKEEKTEKTTNEEKKDQKK